jgi:hypothetical protein
MRMELNLSHLPSDMGHISGFGEEDAGVKGLGTVYQADAVLCHGYLVQMI